MHEDDTMGMLRAYRKLRSQVVQTLLDGREITSGAIATALDVDMSAARMTLDDLLSAGVVELRAPATGEVAKEPHPVLRYALVQSDDDQGTNLDRLRTLIAHSSFGTSAGRLTRAGADQRTTARTVAAANGMHTPASQRFTEALVPIATQDDEGTEQALLTLMDLLTDPEAAALHPKIRETLLAVLGDRRSRLIHQMAHDPLTGLLNRIGLVEHTNNIIRQADPSYPLGLAIINLDHFTVVNNALGHALGNDTLRVMAGRLNTFLGGEHTPARLSTDTFAVLMEGIANTDDLVQFVQNMLQTVFWAVTTFDNHRLAVPASAGITHAAAGQTSIENLLMQADLALADAQKAADCPVVLYDPQRLADRTRRYQLANELPQAIARNELALRFLPDIDLRDGHVVGAMALPYWQHPSLETLAPQTIIDLAETTGAILPLGTWLLGQSCRIAAAWRQRWPQQPLTMSVALTRSQAHNGNLIADVTTALEHAGLDAGQLQLEITEDTLFGANAQPYETLMTLSGLGVRIAVGDFGTGYSSLAYLRHLPIRRLNLHESFIRDLGTGNASTEQLVSAVVQLASTLGIAVAATGVVNEAQEQTLRSIGCRWARGDRYHGPLTLEQIDELLTYHDVTAHGTSEA